MQLLHQISIHTALRAFSHHLNAPLLRSIFQGLPVIFQHTEREDVVPRSIKPTAIPLLSLLYESNAFVPPKYS